MEQKDAQLIQQVLQGDQEAFAILVNKYQKGVHALAWRKIGDFHIAQEITQDAFLRAYQKLETLKNHNLFGGWLYVIASRLCADWFEKKSLPEQSLEVTDMNEVNRASYSRYVAQKQEAEADETRREVVKELLQKLPESERTVMTLHYLGEMTIKTISEFLGVSPNTVKSRLSRARNRLKKEEDMIRQNLGSFQLPANLTETIMREVSRLVPTGPTASKPVLPWALSAASAVLIFLLMGVGTQYLSRFQKPYNLNATSEPTVDLIEALFVVDTPAKPAVRNQAGSSATPGRGPGAGQQPNARFFAAAAADETEIATPQLQWTQTKGPEGGFVNNFFTTNAGDIYAGTSTSLYKLGADGRAWRQVNARKLGSLSIQDWLGTAAQMAAHGNMLYLATDTEILASEDKGETWHALGPHPKGIARGFVVTDSGFYLALTEGVYYAKDGKASWVALKDGMGFKKVSALAVVENTVFAGTNSGLYRLNAKKWELLAVGSTDLHGEKPVIHALAASKHRLYVAAGREIERGFGALFRSTKADDNWWSLYRSTDKGESWYPIDPRERQEREAGKQRGGQSSMGSPLPGSDNIPTVKIFVTGAGVMVTDADGEFFYSTNTGETWTTLERDGSPAGIAPPLLIADTNIFYKGGPSGILRTTDGGESWDPFNTGFVSTPVTTLIVVKGRLYANSLDSYVTSTDGGESWMPLPKDIDYGVFIAAFDDSVYVKKGNNMNSPSPLLRLSTEDNGLELIPEMPGFEGGNSGNMVQAEIDVPEEMMITALREVLQESFPDKVKQNIEDLDLEPEVLKGLDIDLDQLSDLVIEKLEGNPDYAKLMNEAFNKAFEEQVSTGMPPSFGNFAVSGETYYLEYGQRLFRWEPGMAEWYDTGLIDETEVVFPFDYSVEASTSINVRDSIGFKIAVSDSTVYVGKRDGHLFQSFDKGKTWNDVTADLPFSFTEFKGITFAGSTVYVATDKGVAHSSDGTHWHAATNVEGNPLIMERFAVDGTTVYGTTGQYVYQLKEGSNTWEQVTPEIPDIVLSFVVDGNVLYVGTASSGVLRFTLDE
ncbi:MAG: sigma-70 family RNA polymerase sigma factor [Candidatus Poribacteria bacterium]|nr:sigma-70 family RNA polymerase sigma factor [Candidatus Poribacteria bacterium]